MTDRLTARQVGAMLRGLLDKLDDRASPRDLLRCLVAMFEIEAARREAEYERPKPTPGVKFYCSAVPERTSCWGSNCPPDGCGYPVDARREAERQKPEAWMDEAMSRVMATGAVFVETKIVGDAFSAAKADAPPPPAPLPPAIQARLDERPAAGDGEISHELWCQALDAYRSGYNGHCDGVKAVVLFMQKQTTDAIEARRAELKGKQEYADGLASTLFNTRRTRDEYKARAEAAEAEIYVPGIFECPKCKLTAAHTILSAKDGTMSAASSMDCANGCGPAWRVTWKHRAQEATALFDKCFDEKKAAEAREKRLREVLQHLAYYECYTREGEEPPHVRMMQEARAALAQGGNDG